MLAYYNTILPQFDQMKIQASYKSKNTQGSNQDDKSKTDKKQKQQSLVELQA